MISKTQLSKRTKQKRNVEVVATINLAKQLGHLSLAKKLSSPRSNYLAINLDELDRLTDEKIIVVGKVLGSGVINRKVTIGAFGFSKQAADSLKKAGCVSMTIKEMLQKDKKLTGVTLL